MGENAISPIHNVFKKYKEVIYVNPYANTAPVVILVENTFIGGVAGTIYNASLLATKLAIDVSRITNFSIVGSDIKCRITGSYALGFEAFLNNTFITYFNDVDGLVTSFASTSGQCKTFDGATGLLSVYFPNLTTISGLYAFRGAGYNATLFYMPRCTTLSTSVSGNQETFYIMPFCTVYIAPSMATVNSGGVEGDLAFVITQGTKIKYVSNFTKPSTVTNLSIGTVYASAIQLNFTAPSSTNAIDYYEVWLNGVKTDKTVAASGGFIIGLSPNTSYSIEVKPVDIFFNKSSSNVVAQSTIATYYTDADANAYISAASLTGSEQESAYKLIVDLKTNSLWTKIPAIYPFKGTTAAQHKWNAKNLLDTNAAFRLTFTGAATFSNLGYQLNGSSYANTNLIPSAQQALNSNGATIVVGTNNVANGTDTYEFGVINVNQYSFITAKRENTIYGQRARMNNGLLERTGVNDSRGVLTAVRQNSTVSKLIKNGNVIATDSAGGGSLSSIACFIGGLNLNGAIYGNSNQRIQMVIMHEGLSDAEVATLHSIIDLSESIAGRKTW